MPLLDPFTVKIERRRDVEFYKDYTVDNKFPLILLSDPHVALMGAKKGDVLVYHKVMIDKLPTYYIEVRYVDTQ